MTVDVSGRGRPTEDDRRGYQTRNDVTPVKTRAGSLTGGRAREDVLWRNQILASGISPAFRGRENGADDKWGLYGFERDARGAGKPKERRVARTTRYPDLFHGHFKIPEKTRTQDLAGSSSGDCSCRHRGGALGGGGDIPWTRRQTPRGGRPEKDAKKRNSVSLGGGRWGEGGNAGRGEGIGNRN